MATLLERLGLQKRARVGKFDSSTIAREMGLFPTTGAGVTVTEQGALALSTVYACIYRISSTCASLALNIYQRSGREVTLAESHPAFDLVRYEPNGYQTAYEFFEALYTQALMYGVGYAMITRDNRGDASQLDILHYHDVEAKIIAGEKVYVVKDLGIVRPENMLELANLGRLSPIRLHRENLGLAKAAQDYGAEFFANGGKPTGILTAKQPMKTEQVQQLAKSWKEGSGGTKVVPFDMAYSAITLSPEEAQFIQSRKFQAEEICRIFSVPPDLVQVPGQSTFNNVEQQSIQFARHTITPWAIRLSQEVDRKLIQSFQRPQIYSRHDMTDLYRGDMAARANFYTQMLQVGVMSINEARMKEDMNPVEGGDVHTVQVNQIALEYFNQYSEKLSHEASESSGMESQEHNGNNDTDNDNA
jgi:HK97 family phage portal protein